MADKALKHHGRWRPLVMFALGAVTVTFVQFVRSVSFTYNRMASPGLAGRMETLGDRVGDSGRLLGQYAQTLYRHIKPIEQDPDSGDPEANHTVHGYSVLSNYSQTCKLPPWNITEGVYVLPQGYDVGQYFIRLGNTSCLLEGVAMDRLNVTERWIFCPCKSGWHGKECSIPDSVYYSNYPLKLYPPEPRTSGQARRIIQAFPFNIEYELLETRLSEIGDLVDVFMILESNFTAYGDPRPLHLLNYLQQNRHGSLDCKIVRVYLDYFPNEGHTNGWIIDDLTRNYITQHGLVKQIHNYTGDDIFMLHDADEIPSRETLLFLKLHDGYPIPFGFYLWWNVYGFFWSQTGPANIYSGATVAFISQVLDNKCMRIRPVIKRLQSDAAKLNVYLKSHPRTRVKPWSFGNTTHPAGWHCSWCGTPEAIRTKLVSAQNGDFPRWGDYPEKTNVTYIQNLIKTGTWFNGKQKFVKRIIKDAYRSVPKYILNNSAKYSYLIKNLYLEKS